MGNVAETARKALEVLDRDGWCKGSPEFSPDQGEFEVWTPGFPHPVRHSGYRTGSHCLGGVWNIALHGRCSFTCSDASYEPLIRVILSQYPELDEQEFLAPSGVITYLNDRPDITEADVRAILEKLAAGEA